MIRVEKEERYKVFHLFEHTASAIVLAAFDGGKEGNPFGMDIGELWVDEANHASAILQVNHMFYIGGNYMNHENMKFLMALREKTSGVCFLVPQHQGLIADLDEYFTAENIQVTKTERHLMHLNWDDVNVNRLIRFVSEIPSQYKLCNIDEKLFEQARNGQDAYLNNFIALYNDYDEFQKKGLGYFLLENETVIGGISAYARYDAGVEVQIAVNPANRGQHLARSLGAAFLLECKRRRL